MKTLISLLIFAMCSIGCGSSAVNSSSTSNSSTANAAAKTPSKPVKQIDISSLLGKTKDEVKKIVGSEPKAEMPEELEWRITDKYDLDVNFDKGKAYKIDFALPSGLGTSTPEEFGGVIGLELSGTRSDSSLAANFTGVQTPSGPAEVSVSKTGGTYKSALVQVPLKK